MDSVGALLMARSVETLLSLGLGYAVRHTAAGRWAMGPGLGWLALMLEGTVLGMLWRAVRPA